MWRHISKQPLPLRHHASKNVWPIVWCVTSYVKAIKGEEIERRERGKGWWGEGKRERGGRDESMRARQRRGFVTTTLLGSRVMPLLTTACRPNHFPQTQFWTLQDTAVEPSQPRFTRNLSITLARPIWTFLLKSTESSVLVVARGGKLLRPRWRSF